MFLGKKAILMVRLSMIEQKLINPNLSWGDITLTGPLTYLMFSPNTYNFLIVN